MRCYLAGPMSGIPHFNFPLFNRITAQLRDEGHEVFNPAERDNERHGKDISVDNPTGCPQLATKKHGFSLREALAEDLEYICLQADAICMLPGWEKSNGARAEHAVATALGHRVIYLHEGDAL